jgi:hypothetical protein
VTERLLLVLTVVGFVVPNALLGIFIADEAQIARWWLCIPASLLVGLCFGLPLFLLMRERALKQATAPQT